MMFSGKSPPKNIKITSFSLSRNPIWALYYTQDLLFCVNYEYVLKKFKLNKKTH